MPLVNPFSIEALKVLGGLKSTRDIPDRIFHMAEGLVKGEKRGDVHNISHGRDNVKDEVLCIHLLLRSVSAKYGYPSAAGRVAADLVKRHVREGIWAALYNAYDRRAGKYREDEVIMHFSDLLDPQPIRRGHENGWPLSDFNEYSVSREDKFVLKYALPRDRVLPLLRGLDRRLTDLYIFNGYVAASLKDMVDYYCEAVRGKAIEVLSETWRLDDPRADALAELVSRQPRRIEKIYARFVHGRRKGRPLAMEHFPPCIMHTLEGVTTGSRNYAITVLLTSFLSYARIAPVGSGRDSKISDYLRDISAVENEVLPMIEEAAKRCEPPLFEDQPMERMNVIYHLGFGLTGKPKLEDAGRSNWYFPPNCDKIQREAPSLCTPDAHCRIIKNPLSYYAKKLFPKKKEEKAEKGKRVEKNQR
jgi:DNA primase large subunit